MQLAEVETEGATSSEEHAGVVLELAETIYIGAPVPAIDEGDEGAEGDEDSEGPVELLEVMRWRVQSPLP